MELKNLFSKFTPGEEKKEHFLALEIGLRHVWVAVWQTEGGIKIVSLGNKEKWDGNSLGSLTAASDASLASALEDLPEEPNKVVFGLPETWVSGKKIVLPRLADLKLLCQKLDLKPVGFVVTTEAIIQYLKILEGTLPSAILINVGKEEILLSLVKTGKNLGTQVIGKSDNFGNDVYEGIARFGKEETFPSRILLYNTDLESERQALLSYEWEESLFLHFPKVEILEKEISIKAVAIGGGEEVADSLGLRKEVSAKDLGFIQEEDVMEETEKKEIKEEEVKKGIEEFVEEKRPKKFVLPNLPKFRLPKIKIPHFQLSKLTFKRRFPLVIGVVGLFLFVLGGVATAFYWYFPKAQVTVFVEPRSLEKEIEVGLDPSLTLVDLDNQQIPGEIIEVRVKESKEGNATGEKLVGDKTRGEIDLHNFTTSAKSFERGAVIVGPDNLEFSLDVDVAVASASSAWSEDWEKVISPGKTKVTVTASKIGPEYNLASGSEFNVKEFSSSSYRARNEKAFSGGTSRKVEVVSAEDQEELLAGLTVELETKIKEELEKITPQEKRILEEGVLTSITNKEFDKAVGSETETLRLDLEMKAKTLAYSLSDLENLLEKVISDSIPSGFILKKMEMEAEGGEIKQEGNGVFKVHLNARLVPDLDLEEIKKNLMGKYHKIGEEYLRSLPNFVRAKIIITPNLPARLRVFPRFVKNIDIKVEIKE